ncbi:MAG: hypothetical protein GX785_15115 [Armatimonadetes bacterium]|jgi:hypothetical protein|nr:hypothetical protein [Armatimonadota bacterium]
MRNRSSITGKRDRNHLYAGIQAPFAVGWPSPGSGLPDGNAEEGTSGACHPHRGSEAHLGSPKPVFLLIQAPGLGGDPEDPFFYQGPSLRGGTTARMDIG